jgi:uncharacterized protein
MKNLVNKIYEDEEFISIIKDIINNETVQEMKNFRQHYNTSCFDHCLCVSYYSYLICKKLHLDYKSVARAGMIHDLFLYDWRTRVNGRKGLHAFTHPKTALENSLKLFKLNNKEKDIILKHMWPVTIVPPKYLESYIITFVDKHCAISETFNDISKICTSKTAFRYAYVFLSLLIISF